MSKPNDFKKRIFECPCQRCQAIVWLTQRGAELKFSPTRAGRLCELAVVAASGTEGMSKLVVVEKRRAYAKHLGIELVGPISNSKRPVHIDWATKYSNHQTAPKDRINLGQAQATCMDGRYFIA